MAHGLIELLFLRKTKGLRENKQAQFCHFLLSVCIFYSAYSQDAFKISILYGKQRNLAGAGNL